jgi:hypothetical protein
VKRALLGFLAAAAGAFCLVTAGPAASDPAWAGQCGIATGQTVWAEYGWPSLLPILARPGTLLAVTNNPNSDYAAEARARGAATYAFDLHLAQKVGTPSAPADPATIEAAAETEYQKAVTRTGGCTTPLIVENELFGASAPTPWTSSIAQYRANVLALLQSLAAQGAHPVLLVNKPPYLGSSDAVAWWLSVSKVADVVREVYIPATTVWPLGATLGNRMLRDAYRHAIADFTSIGIPPSRVGIMLSFLSQPGGGGRSGLEPVWHWFQVVKWEALSAKEVASEVGLGSVFSWGWQEWNPAEADPSKPRAACVWLWARNRSLCPAPTMLGPHFDGSRTEGQIILRHGEFCAVPGHVSIGVWGVNQLEALTGDRDAALSALLERLAESDYASVSAADVTAAQQAVIATSFHHSRGAYVAALHQAHATVPIARAILADELRRARLAQMLPAGSPSARQIRSFYASYPQLLVRRVRVSPRAAWVGGGREGFVVSGAAPERLFAAPAGRRTRIETLLGPYEVKPFGAAVPLGALPLGVVRPAIVAALRGFERAQAFDRWTIARQRGLAGRVTCQRDHVPQPAAVDLTEYLPFLRLS